MLCAVVFESSLKLKPWLVKQAALSWLGVPAYWGAQCCALNHLGRNALPLLGLWKDIRTQTGSSLIPCFFALLPSQFLRLLEPRCLCPPDFLSVSVVCWLTLNKALNLCYSCFSSLP